MDKKARQKALKSSKDRQDELDNISPEDLEKIKAHQASTEGSLPVDQEWMLLAEFGMNFGWQAYLDAKNDAVDEQGNLKVNAVEMLTLIEASRKLGLVDMYNAARVSFIGAVAANQKKPGQVFNQLTKDIVKKAKVVE